MKWSKFLPASFRTRLLLGFGLSLLLSILLALQAMIFSNRLADLRNIKELILNTRLVASELLQSDKDFITNNYLNLSYYRTGESDYLQHREIQMFQLGRMLQKLDSGLLDQRFSQFDLTYINFALEEYQQTFENLTSKQLQRGFKDYGLEGRMRDMAHQLEDHSTCISVDEILMLRRHEKDFFLRYDQQYVSKLNQLAGELVIKCQESNKLGAANDEFLLEEYRESFNAIVTLDFEIGKDDSQGLRNVLKLKNNLILESLADVSRRLSHLADRKRSNTILVIITLVVIALVLNILVGTFLSRTITRPIEKLTLKMRSLKVDSETELNLDEFKKSELSKEMRILLRSYTNMVNKLRAQIKEIDTQRKKLESQNNHLKSLNDELDNFAYSVSHDLRSPLTSIMGLLQLSKEENPQHYEELYLHHIEDCVERLDGFIQNMLHFTKNQNLELQTERIDLEKIMEEIKSRYLIHFRTDVSIELSVSKDFEFYSDRIRLMIILQNLLSNSIRYRDPDKEQIKIQIKGHVSDDHGVIEVIDNGIGIKDTDQQKVFNMFFKNLNSNNGSGLGLFIVKKIIDKLDGIVELQSELGVGTKVTLRVPNRESNKTDSQGV